MEAEDIEALRFCRGIGFRGANIDLRPEMPRNPLFGRPNEKSPVARAFFSQPAPLLRDGLDVDRLIAFRARGDIEGHLLVFLQGLETAALDRREVREQILAAAVRSDEPEALGIVEPLDRTCIHLNIS